MSMMGAWIAGGAILGGYLSSQGSRSAGADAANAMNNANALQQEFFNKNQENIEPWLKSGRWALGQMQDLMSGNMKGFYQDPGYKFALQQGQQALQRSAAGRGDIFTGGTGKSLDQYSQGLASQQYGNYWNRLAGMAGEGQNASGQLGQYGMNAANQMGANTMNGGGGMAASELTQGNAWSGALNQGMNNWMRYSQMNNGSGNGGATWDNLAGKY